MKELNFEKFTGVGGRFNYSISLNKSGGFSFNSGFYKKYELRQFPYVIIFFDKGVKAVGFSFIKKKVKGALKISHIKDIDTAHVKSNSFLSAYDIKPKLFARQYIPKEYKMEGGEENIFYILLEEKKK